MFCKHEALNSSPVSSRKEKEAKTEGNHLSTITKEIYKTIIKYYCNKFIIFVANSQFCQLLLQPLFRILVLWPAIECQMTCMLWISYCRSSIVHVLILYYKMKTAKVWGILFGYIIQLEFSSSYICNIQVSFFNLPKWNYCINKSLYFITFYLSYNEIYCLQMYALNSRIIDDREYVLKKYIRTRKFRISFVFVSSNHLVNTTIFDIEDPVSRKIGNPEYLHHRS
jgi:hypothetical protein